MLDELENNVHNVDCFDGTYVKTEIAKNERAFKKSKTLCEMSFSSS